MAELMLIGLLSVRVTAARGFLLSRQGLSSR